MPTEIVLVLVSLLSVAIGAYMNGLFARRNSDAATRFERKSEVYFAAIEPVFNLQSNMKIFLNNAGRSGMDAHADEIGGIAINAVMDARGHMDRHELKLMVLGSVSVNTTFAQLRTHLDGYMAELKRQLDIDHIFLGAPAKAFLEQLDTDSTKLMNQMRVDLGYGNQHRFFN